MPKGRKLGKLSFLSGAFLSLSAFIGGCGFAQSPESFVDRIRTPEQSQRYVNAHISYAYEDLTEDKRCGRGAIDLEKGGMVQSLEETLRRKKGVCSDITVFIGASVRDNGYPPYFLHMASKVGDESFLRYHAVFPYTSKEGKWGSAGINQSDYIVPRYESVRALSEALCTNVYRDSQLKGYILFDLSSFDLIRGNKKGRIPFSEKDYKKDNFPLVLDWCDYMQDERIQTVYSPAVGERRRILEKPLGHIVESISLPPIDSLTTIGE